MELIEVKKYVRLDDTRSFQRLSEIWCNSNGRILCVRENCCGMRMASEIGNNPRQAKTFDGGYRMTDAERAEWRQISAMEFGEINPTCECGAVRV